MFDKLEDLIHHYEELMNLLSEPDVANDANRFKKLMKEQSDLAPIVETYKKYKECKQNIEDSLAILDEESDEEMRELAKEELKDSKEQVEELEKELFRRRKDFAAYTAEQVLEGMVHQVLGRVLLKSLGLKPKDKAGEWSDRDVRRIADRFKQWKVGIERVNGFDFAQVTAGGVLTSQLDPDTMEVRKHPGLYITGELLDVDGICGGYNLQWAWTSGYLAGTAAAGRVH